MASKFTPEIRGALIERFAAGVTVEEAARAADVSTKTLKRWLTRGRREEQGEFATFLTAVEEAREQARSRPDPMTPEEHRLAVSESARNGSVQAMKLYWEMICADRDEAEEAPTDPLEALDELAAKRAARV